MDTIKNNQSNLRDKSRNKEAHVGAVANEFLNDGKKLANELYKEGLNQINEVEENVEEYSHELLRKVQQNPLTSILIAGGIGFLLSTFLKK